MGAYINPEGQNKEEWLRDNGIQVNLIDILDWNNKPKDCLPVVFMDNGFFTAAGIAFSQRELDNFTSPEDSRPKVFYFVEISKLLTVSNLKFYLEEGE